MGYPGSIAAGVAMSGAWPGPPSSATPRIARGSDPLAIAPGWGHSLYMSIFSLFHLKDTDHQGTIELIREGVEFRGTNLWMLVLAMLIASIGLNVNSTAIIIGAMLVSPLMGPIAGAGLALGIYDTDLLKRALINLAIMTAVSLIASAAYFSLTPIQEASAEMLARVRPSFFDVLIAFFGGSALIIALSRKTRSSNTLAGVAIATALMPPLCTAGYGLAMRDWSFFLGALYLYLINSIFIGFATWIFSKYLKLGNDQKPVENLKRKQVFATVAAILVFIAPSLWFAVDMSMESSFSANVNRFVKTSMNFPSTKVIDIAYTRSANPPQIDLTLVGAPVSSELAKYLETLLVQHHLEGVKLNLIQTGQGMPGSGPLVDSLPAQVLPGPAMDLASSPAVLEDGARVLVLARVDKEARLVFPGLLAIDWADLVQEGSGLSTASPGTVFTRWSSTLSGEELPELKARFGSWLRLRLLLPAIQVF